MALSVSQPAALRHSTCWQLQALRGAVLWAIVASLCGCGSLRSNYGAAAQVRFIAASRQAPVVDFYAGPVALVYNQGFGTPSSYLPLPPGETRLAAMSSTASQMLVTATGELLPAHSYTVLMGNTMGALTETLIEDQTAPAPAGDVEFRILDQVTHPGAVDVYVRAPSGKLAGSRPVAMNIGLNGNSGYVALPAGTYAVLVLPAGTVPSAATVPLYTGSLERYEAGAVTTAVLIDGGGPSSTAVDAILASDVDPAASI